jgi:hypothetical protein
MKLALFYELRKKERDKTGFLPLNSFFIALHTPKRIFLMRKRISGNFFL